MTRAELNIERRARYAAEHPTLTRTQPCEGCGAVMMQLRLKGRPHAYCDTQCQRTAKLARALQRNRRSVA